MEIAALGPAPSLCVLLQTPCQEGSTCSREKPGSFLLASSRCNKAERFMDIYLLKISFHRVNKACRNEATLRKRRVFNVHRGAGQLFGGVGHVVFLC